MFLPWVFPLEENRGPDVTMVRMRFAGDTSGTFLLLCYFRLLLFRHVYVFCQFFILFVFVFKNKNIFEQTKVWREQSKNDGVSGTVKLL